MVSSVLRSLYDANGRFMAERQRQEAARYASKQASRRVVMQEPLSRHPSGAQASDESLISVNRGGQPPSCCRPLLASRHPSFMA